MRFGFISAPSGADAPTAKRIDFVTQTLAVNDKKAPHGVLTQLVAGRTTYEITTRPGSSRGAVEVELTPKRNKKIPLLSVAKASAKDRADAGCPEGMVPADAASAPGPLTWSWSAPHNSLNDMNAARALAAGAWRRTSARCASRSPCWRFCFPRG